jgi:hypothetical protein
MVVWVAAVGQERDDDDTSELPKEDFNQKEVWFPSHSEDQGFTNSGGTALPFPNHKFLPRLYEFK